MSSWKSETSCHSGKHWKKNTYRSTLYRCWFSLAENEWLKHVVNWLTYRWDIITLRTMELERGLLHGLNWDPVCQSTWKLLLSCCTECFVMLNIMSSPRFYVSRSFAKYCSVALKILETAVHCRFFPLLF